MLSQLHALQLQLGPLLLFAADQCSGRAVHVWLGQAGAAPGLQQDREAGWLPASAWQAGLPSPPAAKKKSVQASPS